MTINIINRFTHSMLGDFDVQKMLDIPGIHKNFLTPLKLYGLHLMQTQ